MHVKRLHILLGGIGLTCLGIGGFKWWNVQKQNPSRAAFAPARQVQADPAMEKLRKATRQSIANVGEAYRTLHKQYGDIPPISNPLRAAKQLQVEGKTELAMRSAREAWRALKTYRTQAEALTDTYQVVRGDTLWRIAKMQSPTRAGEAWVTIWKANKTLVSDFNRIEVGWTLKIPPETSQYVMPFWKPLGIQ